MQTDRMQPPQEAGSALSSESTVSTALESTRTASSSDDITATSAPAPGSGLTTSTENQSKISALTSSSAVPSDTASVQSSLEISPGALAGAIVGPAVAASLLTLAITLLFIRRNGMKKKRRRRRAIPLGEIKYNSSILTQPSKWQQHLPQPIDDETVQRKVQTLMDQVDAHITNFYGNQQGSTEVSHDSLQALDEMVPSLGLPLHILLTQSPSPTDLIKRYLAGLLLHSDFLPPAVSTLQKSFSIAPNSVRSRNVATQAWGLWRVLTAYLQPELRKDQIFLAQRQTAIDAAADQFVQAFQPWCVRDSDRHAHLVAVLARAADLALLLFAQPYAYTWQWTGTAEEFVILPGLLRVSDEEGTHLSMPTTLVKSTMALTSWGKRL